MIARILLSIATVLVATTMFHLSPYYALLRFGQAANEGDIEAVRSRIDYPELRRSLAGQLARGYLRATGRAEPGASASSSAAAFAADPLLAEFVSEQALFRLIAGPHSALSGRGAEVPGLIAGALNVVDAQSLRELWNVYLAAEGRGFRKVVFRLPPNAGAADRFDVMWRLSDGTWKLAGINLPDAVEAQLVQQMMKKAPSAT
jgi:hypothetical protein